MDITLEQIAVLKEASLADLMDKYEQLFDRSPSIRNRGYLINRLIYRIQEDAYGSLTTECQNNIRQLIDSYDPINRIKVKSNSGKTESGRDIRLPMPGSCISKNYKGKRIEVKVLKDGFEYESTLYKNLSTVAQAVTGAHWNGYIFFGFKNYERKQRS